MRTKPAFKSSLFHTTLKTILISLMAITFSGCVEQIITVNHPADAAAGQQFTITVDYSTLETRPPNTSLVFGGMLVPNGTVLVSANSGSAQGAFTRNNNLEAQLELSYPSPTGYHWLAGTTTDSFTPANTYTATINLIINEAGSYSIDYRSGAYLVSTDSIVATYASSLGHALVVAATDTDTDTDTDGMPDDWELLYGLNPLVNDAGLDPDADGISNLNEYINGTDPTVWNPPPPANDFNGDGTADVLLRNSSTGEWYMAEMNGLTINTQGVVSGMFLNPNHIIVSTGDFDGDGDADILTRGNAASTQSGLFRLETTNGKTHTGGSWLPATVSTDLNDEVISTKDFDADGNNDLLLRNTGTGVWTLYYLNGAAVKSYGSLNASTDTCYSFQGDGDYDGNGYPDLLLRYDQCGGSLYPWRVYTTDGDLTVLQQGEPVGLSKNTGWGAVVSDRDFNGDGKDDVLMRALGGSVQQWLLYDMDGTAAPSGSGLLNLATQNQWQIATDADLNADARADIILRNSGSGQWYGYLLNGRTINSSGVLDMLINPLWQLQYIDDHNGDGKGDITLRNAATGQWLMHLMNGLSVQEKGSPSILFSLDYQLQNQN